MGGLFLSQNADAMYQHAYGERNPTHSTLNAQVSNSRGMHGAQTFFARDGVEGSGHPSFDGLCPFLLALASFLPPFLSPGAKPRT